MSFTIAPTPVRDPGLLQMIGESEAEQAALYAAHLRTAFSPEQLEASGTQMVLASAPGGAPLGCGGVPPLKGYGELKRIFTTRAARGTGVARAIIAELEAIARADGFPLMRLETGLASPEAIALYTACGYRTCGPFGGYAENGSSVFMEKPL